MSKIETMERTSVFEEFQNTRAQFYKDFNQFDNDCTTMSIYENLIGISEQCPIKLNNVLTQAFALLQEKNPNKNYIKTLATFSEMLLILSSYDDFIHTEYERFYKSYLAFQKFRAIRNGRN
jgi:hypothetical protein